MPTNRPKSVGWAPPTKSHREPMSLVGSAHPTGTQAVGGQATGRTLGMCLVFSFAILLVGRVVVADEEIGWVVGSGDPVALADAIEAAADDPQTVAAMGRRARQIAESTYSLDSVITSMVEFLELESNHANE